MRTINAKQELVALAKTCGWMLGVVCLVVLFAWAGGFLKI